jgi:hypothetical protein
MQWIAQDKLVDPGTSITIHLKINDPAKPELLVRVLSDGDPYDEGWRR